MQNQNINSKDKKVIKYEDWKKQFKFEKLKNTTVLSVSYSDTDKSLIEPVLNKISIAYQEYWEK